MSITQDLMRKYYKKKQPIDVSADTRNTLAVGSYINPYDMLVQEAQSNKNFNINTWHRAIQLGDQDTYLSFLRQNKDTQMSDAFYDSHYYDYDTQMLELYKTAADDKVKKSYKFTQFDPRKDKDVEVEIELTDKEYIEKQLQESYELREFQITRILEQSRKDLLGWWELTGHSVAATLLEFGEGALSGVTGLLDFLVAGMATTGRTVTEGGDWLDNYVDFYTNEGFTALEKEKVRASLDEYERLNTHFKDIDGDIKPVGLYFAGVANSIGMMIPAIVINGFTGGAGGIVQMAGTGAFYTGIYANNIYENATDPATKDSPSWLKVSNAATSAAVEASIEYLLGEMLGGTISNRLIGLEGKSTLSVFKELSRGVGWSYLAKSALQEGLEEFLQDIGTHLVDQFTGMLWEGYEHTGLSLQTLIDSFLIGAISSIVMSGSAVAGNKIKDAYSAQQAVKADRYADKAKTDPKFKEKAIKAAERSAKYKGPFIEGADGTLEPVTGLRRMVWTELMSDFYSAVDKVEQGKASIELAQEVYAAQTIIAQYYASFDSQRIENIERLLNRAITADQEAKTLTRAVASTVIDAETGLSREGLSYDMRLDKKVAKAERSEAFARYARELMKDFTDMVGGASARYAGRLEKVIEKHVEKFAEGDINKIVGAVDTDGNVYNTTDPEIQKIEQKLKDSLLIQNKEYDWIYLTDGNIAIEEDKMLFVPVKWINHYKDSEIYQFLEQERVLQTVYADETLKPLIGAIVDHNKEFRGVKNVTRDRAMMDFLFNSSVHQHFLLSQDGKNIFKYRDIVFRIYEIMQTQMSEKGLRGEMLNKITEQVKETHRKGVMVAVLNWNINPQLVGADFVLTEADRKAIRQYQVKRNHNQNAVKGGVLAGDYSRTAEQILEEGRFSTREKEIVRRGIPEDASDVDRLITVAMLHVEDEFMGINVDGGLQSFAMPIQAFHFENSRADIAYVSDVLKEFHKTYEISARELFADRVMGLKFSTLEKIQNEMAVMKVDTYQDFVTRTLEGLIGDRFAVVPSYYNSGNVSYWEAYNAYNRIDRDKAFFSMDLNMLTDENLNSMIIQMKVIASYYKDKTFIDYANTLEEKNNRTRAERIKTYKDLVKNKDKLLKDFRVDRETAIESYREIQEGRSNTHLDFQVVKKIPGEDLIRSDIKTSNDFKNMFPTMDSVLYVRNFVKSIQSSSERTRLVLDYRVVFDTDLNAKGVTYFNDRVIAINPRLSNDYVNTFIHELNHAIQNEFGMPNGFTPDTVAYTDGFREHVMKTYPDFVEYMLRKHNHIADTLRLRSGMQISLSGMNIVSKAAYNLVQGELWARYYMHNGKLLTGYRIESVPGTLRAYVVSPDGKHRFPIDHMKRITDGMKSTQEAPNPIQVRNKMAQTFDNILGAYHDPESIRNTVHAQLTRKHKTELTASILNTGLPVTTRVMAGIDEIIKTAHLYLSQDMKDALKKQGRDLSEGSVYHFLKDYYETNFDGISIDRDGVTHEYVFVDDTAFDDMFKHKVSDKINTETDLVTDGTLESFYRPNVLDEWAIPRDIPVITGKDVHTQASFTKEYIKGAIFIRTHEGMTNQEFVRKLNHEFRHIVQRYHRFELGFTADFKVTPELLADVKKHAPEIYKDEELIALAKSMKADPEIFITQEFVYHLMGAEINAQGIKSQILNAKPAFTDIEAGKPTIYLPWYNSKTGEGRHQTEFLAQRAKEGIPRVEKKAPVKRETITAKDAEGTNLEYFREKGVQRQMPADLKNFIVATTGNESKLPKEIIHAIQKRKLTKTALFEWFRKVDAADVNQYTFDLINKTIFKNDTITSMTELDVLLSGEQIRVWWAASILFKKEGLSNETFLKSNSAQRFIDFLTSLENSQWLKKLGEIMPIFDWYWVQNKQGKNVRKLIPMEQSSADYSRVLAMQYFDGTLSGAFYTADSLRTVIRKYQDLERRTHEVSFGDKEINTISESRIEEVGSIGNDIIALYGEQMHKSEDDMITELGLWYLEELKEKGVTSQQEQMKNMMTFIKELRDLSIDDISARYEQVLQNQMTGAPVEGDIRDTSKVMTSTIRTNIVANIKSLGTRIDNAVRDGKVIWSNLPKEIRDMFELTTVKVDGKTYKKYNLKPEVYSVGRGTVKGSTSFDYKRHDTSKILANRDLLRRALSDIRANVFANKEGTKMVASLRRKLDTQVRKNIEQAQEMGKLRETKIEVPVKSKTTDTPNHFTIVSKIEMPTILRDIFDTSFADMADTKVQFASKDESGQLYNKNDKTFKSRVQHEVSNWDAFYEANRAVLIGLTRSEALDIIEFIQYGVTTLDGPGNKLNAFQIFMLGYIVDGARRNFNNWNFSNAEIEFVTKLYESKASEAGSALNAVGQMTTVIDPFKRIHQRMLERYNITEIEQKRLVHKIGELREAKTTQERKNIGADIAEELARLERLMYERETDYKTGKPVERGFGKRWHQKLKAWRYVSMLSRPTTWVRNLQSNIIVNVFNTSADFIGDAIFRGKTIEGQWNLNKVQVTEDVKKFINEHIKESELFMLLYDGSTKYTERSKNVNAQKELFMSMIINSLERKYAADNRFDSNAMNNIAKFIDRMISDKYFINLAATRYLGKILTLENVDLTRGLTDDVLTYFAEAVVMANEDYMHKRSFASDMVDSLKHKHPGAYEVVTFFQPFINSSLNWFNELFKYTPAGLARAIHNSVKLESRIDKIAQRRARGEVLHESRVEQYLVQRDVGKGVIGTMLTIIGILMSQIGMIRLDEDDDKFYVTIGDLKLDISGIFASSSLLIGASLGQIADKDFMDVMSYVAEYMFDGFVIKEFLDIHRHDKTFLEVMITETESGMKSYLPQFVQLFVTALNNEKIRYSPGFKGVWERWLNTWVPSQPAGNRVINPYTGEVQTKHALPFFGNLLASGILGPKIFWYEMSSVEEFARGAGVNKRELAGKITVDGVEHELDRQRLNEKYGQLNKKSLAQLSHQKHYVQVSDGTYKTLAWSQLNEAQRKRVIDRTMTHNADIAKIFVWTQSMNKKYYASDNLWKELRALGMTRNVYRGDKGFVG